MIDNITDSLLKNTEKNIISWTEDKNIFTSDISKTYVYETDDKLTKFNIEIDLNNDYNICYSKLIIRNSAIPGGFQIINNTNNNVKKLSSIIYDREIKPNLNIRNQKTVYKNILKSIGTISSRRDDRIKEILDDPSDTKKEPKKEEPFWKKWIK